MSDWKTAEEQRLSQTAFVSLVGPHGAWSWRVPAVTGTQATFPLQCGSERHFPRSPWCLRPHASKRETERAGSIKGTSRMLEPHICLHAIGQNRVTWPHLAEMKSGKCSLYSKWAAPSKMLEFIVTGGEMDRSLCPDLRC